MAWQEAHCCWNRAAPSCAGAAAHHSRAAASRNECVRRMRVSLLFDGLALEGRGFMHPVGLLQRVFVVEIRYGGAAVALLIPVVSVYPFVIHFRQSSSH